MNQPYTLLLIGLLLIGLSIPTHSQESNQSINNTTSTNQTIQPAPQTNASQENPTNHTGTNQTPASNQTIQEPPQILPPRKKPASPQQAPTPPSEPDPLSPPPLSVAAFDVQKALPGEVPLGDSQLNLLVSNTGNQPLTNLNAVLSGEGVSVYTQEPVTFLSPGDSKWLLVWINTKKTGKIPLDIRIQDKQFRLYITALDSQQSAQAKHDAQDQAALKRRVREIQEDIANLTDIYEAFTRDYILKESKNYQLTNLNLQDAKIYLRSAQSSLAKGDLSDASAQIVLLRSELTDIREKLLLAQPKPRTIKDSLKDNVPILSGMIGVLVGGLAVYEKLKRKTEDIKKNSGLFGKNVE